MRKLRIKEKNLSKFNTTNDYSHLFDYEILASLAAMHIVTKEKCFNILKLKYSIQIEVCINQIHNLMTFRFLSIVDIQY